MSMRLLSERVVDQILGPEFAIKAAEDAFKALSCGGAIMPLRAEIHADATDAHALIMPGLIGSETLGVKLVGSVARPGAPGGQRYTTCMMLIWDGATFAPRGLIAADALNDYRTAAGLAAASRHLARPDSRTHVLIGAGKLGYASALYLSHVLPFERVILLSRTRSKVLQLAERLRAAPALAETAILTDVPAGEAIAQADVITAITSSHTPVFDGARVKPGTHINLGGANQRTQREMDDAAAARSTFWLDSNEGCWTRAGDIIVPLEAGVIDRSQIRGEIGALMAGSIPGRQHDDEITVFKSLGVATQDLVLGARIMDIAERKDLGIRFDALND